MLLNTHQHFIYGKTVCGSVLIINNHSTNSHALANNFEEWDNEFLEIPLVYEKTSTAGGPKKVLARVKDSFKFINERSTLEAVTRVATTKSKKQKNLPAKPVDTSETESSDDSMHAVDSVIYRKQSLPAGGISNLPSRKPKKVIFVDNPPSDNASGGEFSQGVLPRQVPGVRATKTRKCSYPDDFTHSIAKRPQLQRNASSEAEIEYRAVEHAHYPRPTNFSYLSPYPHPGAPTSAMHHDTWGESQGESSRAGPSQNPYDQSMARPGMKPHKTYKSSLASGSGSHNHDNEWVDVERGSYGQGVHHSKDMYHRY